MSYRTNYVHSRDRNNGYRNPCMCPFHQDFQPLMRKFFPSGKGYIWREVCKNKKMVYDDRAGLKNHCLQNKACWKHQLLNEFLERLYPATKDKKKKGGKPKDDK